MRLPLYVRRLLWDVVPSRIDIVAHADFILERVMARGGLAAMQWLRSTYSAEEMADFLRRKGRRLPPRERAYWSLIAGVKSGQVKGGGRPSWL